MDNFAAQNFTLFKRLFHVSLSLIGGIIVLAAIFDSLNNPVSSIILLLFGLTLIPKFWVLVQKAASRKLNNKLRILTLVVLFFIFGMTVDSEEKKNPNNSDNNATQSETTSDDPPTEQKLYEVLEREDQNTFENIKVLSLDSDRSESRIKALVDKIRTEACNKPCNIDLYDDRVALQNTIEYSSMLGKTTTTNEMIGVWKRQNYVFQAEHNLAFSDFSSNSTQIYPMKDWHYKELKEAEVQQQVAEVKSIPAIDISSKSESNIKSTYNLNYEPGFLTPSKKVRITGFDYGNANIQIDYNVANNFPIYIGYSFSDNPLPESEAWSITGFNKPTSTPVKNDGIRNRTVYVWQNEQSFAPYKMIQAIYGSDGKVGKIAFSKEDLETAMSISSLYSIE